MKIAKKILLVVLGLVAILLIVGLFPKKDYHVEREIIINKPVSDVFNYAKFLKNQKDYGVWAKRDRHAKMEFTGTDGTVGFISRWDSKIEDVGAGEQEIKEMIPNQRINFELRFKRPHTCIGQSYMTTDSLSANQTKVKWGFDGKMDYPMNLMMLVMNMDKMLGTDLETGLKNMKVIVEAMPPTPIQSPCPSLPGR